MTLVYHSGALGDFIAILPALQLWRKKNPGERIALLGNPAYGRLAIDFGFVDEAWDVERACYASLFSPEISQDALRPFRKFNNALVFADPGSPIAGNLRKAGIPRILTQKPFPDERIPIARYHCSLIDEKASGRTIRFPLLRSERPRDATAKFALIHPGSGSPLKNWPENRFAGVALESVKNGIAVGWITGPAERSSAAPHECFPIREKSLSEIAALAAGCSLYLGNDSGISHLAAASGAPCVVLFGPSDPLVWAPCGNVKIITRRTSCAPCHGKAGARSPSCDRRCIERIGIREVLDAVMAVLRK